MYFQHLSCFQLTGKEYLYCNKSNLYFLFLLLYYELWLVLACISNELTIENYIDVHRKSESVTFPDHLYKTLPNLIYFILQHSSTTLRLHTGLSICSRACITANIASTVRRIHSLNQALSKLVKAKHTLQRKIKLFATELDLRDLTRNTLRILQWYKNVLTKRIWVKHLQLNESRHLHKVLFSTSGQFIEQHKLSAILMRYTAYSRRYLHMEEGDFKDELFEINLEIDSHKVDHQSHDEL